MKDFLSLFLMICLSLFAVALFFGAIAGAMIAINTGYWWLSPLAIPAIALLVSLWLVFVEEFS